MIYTLNCRMGLAEHRETKLGKIKLLKDPDLPENLKIASKMLYGQKYMS